MKLKRAGVIIQIKIQMDNNSIQKVRTALLLDRADFLFLSMQPQYRQGALERRFAYLT